MKLASASLLLTQKQVNLFFPYHFRTCLQVTSITSIEALAGSECHDFNPAGVFILSHKNAKIPVQPEGGVSMESDFINILNELMCDEEPDLPTRLHWQEAALNDLSCTNHALGKWFENNSVLYVLSANCSSGSLPAGVGSERRNESAANPGFQPHERGEGRPCTGFENSGGNLRASRDYRVMGRGIG